MSYDNEINEYVTELEKTVVTLGEKVENLEAKIKEYKRLISILDTQQQHVDL